MTDNSHVGCQPQHAALTCLHDFFLFSQPFLELCWVLKNERLGNC